MDWGHQIGTQNDKWINDTRRRWKEKYNHNFSPLITTEYPENIILITHSAGGLGARAYVMDKGNWRYDSIENKKILDISQVITSSGPHTGSDLALIKPATYFYLLTVANILIGSGVQQCAIGNLIKANIFIKAATILLVYCNYLVLKNEIPYYTNSDQYIYVMHHR